MPLALKEYLESHSGVTHFLSHPDPLWIAQEYDDDRVILTCALFSYGNVKAILKFLKNFDFSFQSHSSYYRFQTQKDVEIFCTIMNSLESQTIQKIFYESFVINRSIIDGINGVIEHLYKQTSYRSRGLTFLLGQPIRKIKGNAPMKRWMMFLRWMVRSHQPDLGRWKEIFPHELIMPLDTHTFSVSQQLGLLNRQTYDLQAAIELTQRLKEFDSLDPLKYDFALYRIGQLKLFP